MALAAFGQDLRYGARVLLGHARFTMAALVALGIGIGTNTAVFTAYKAMVARPLEARPAAGHGPIVNLALSGKNGATEYTFGYPDYVDYGRDVSAFHDLIAIRNDRMTLAGSSVSKSQAAEFASVFVISENYFRVFGVEPLRGRVLDPSDDRPHVEAPPVVVSESYWRRRFGADVTLIGRTISLNGAAFTVVGISPEAFVGTSFAAPAFWMPISAESSAHQGDASLHDRTHQAYRLFARLSPGASIGQAQAQMTTVARRLDGEHDARTGGSAPVSALIWPGSPFPLPLALYGGLRVTIALVMAAAALVLVVACANVASLQLARAGVRHAELRTRVSLGATRSRLIRQLLTESALLGVASGALALAAAWAMLRIGVAAVANVLPPEYGSLVFDVTPDPQIFAFVVAISLAAALLFGLAPAFDGSRSAAASGARATTASRRTRRLQNALVGSQVALSLVLAITGGVLIQAARHSLSRETGYDAGQVADLEIQFSDGANEGGARGAAVTAALRVRVQGMPGVISVTSARPPDDNRFVTPAVPVRGGASTTAEPGATPLFYRFVEPGYFQTLGIPIVLGHVWPRGETSAVAILSESAAKRLWPNEDPIGRRVRLGVTDEQLRLPAQVDRSANGLTYEVVGVARDTRGAAFDGGDSRQVYVPLSESQRPSRALLIRFAVDSASLVRQLGPLATTLDPSLVATASTLQDHLKTSAPFIVSSLSAAVASTMGLLGLLLASMGIYGTVNYIVLRRTREVGIRIAVGARPSDVLSLILGESARPVIAGIAVGLVVAASALRLVDGMFFGLGSMDVPSFAGVTAFFIAVALAAALPPARRALRIDPVEALRAD